MSLAYDPLPLQRALTRAEGPRGDGTWRTVIRHGRDAVLPVPGFPDVQVALAAVLPPVSP